MLRIANLSYFLRGSPSKYSASPIISRRSGEECLLFNLLISALASPTINPSDKSAKQRHSFVHFICYIFCQSRSYFQLSCISFSQIHFHFLFSKIIYNKSILQSWEIVKKKYILLYKFKQCCYTNNKKERRKNG